MKINNKFNVILNREIDIYELSTNKLKSHIDIINVENWKTKEQILRKQIHINYLEIYQKLKLIMIT